LTPHNDSPSPTLTACAPRKLSLTCVFPLRTTVYSISETHMQLKMMPIVTTSTTHFGPNHKFPPSIERQLTIECP